MVNKRGGHRQGSGAKKKYGEPTKTISIRVPASKLEHIKKTITDILAVYSTKK